MRNYILTTGLVYGEYYKLTYIYLEMPKFNKTEAELDTHFEKWLYILKNLENLTSRPERLQEKIFSQLFEQAEIAHYNKKEYQQYKESLKQYRDLKNVIDTAKEEAWEEGREEGREESVSLGEHKKEKQMIINMQLAGVELKMISQITGWSIQEIKLLLDTKIRGSNKGEIN